MDQLIEAYRQEDLILFVGAGVSSNLGLPTWDELINEIALQLDYDPDVFKTYGNHLALAEFYKIKKGNIGTLRSWMDREWHNPSIDIETSKIHQLIAEGRFPIIYTTNYDRWLEIAHDHYNKKYVRIRNVGDITKTKNGITEIIKFHGDFEDDSSIVLDETSYFNRLNFESPLDIKLRSDILGKSVLFIGYSLSDINIRLLFHKLSKIWDSQQYQNCRPKSYIFSSKPNPIQEEVLAQWGIKMISSEKDGPEEALEEFLTKLCTSV